MVGSCEEYSNKSGWRHVHNGNVRLRRSKSLRRTLINAVEEDIGKLKTEKMQTKKLPRKPLEYITCRAALYVTVL